MSNEKRDNLRVVRSKSDEPEERPRRHRWIWILVAILAVALVVMTVAYVIVAQSVTYDDYVVTDETERIDTSATRYIAYGDGYVKFSNDGASYITSGGRAEWNQSYEMEDPVAAACEPYIVFADRQGETVYVLDRDGLQGEITVNMPIFGVDVASQGTVALLTMDSGTGYLSLYDKNGGQIAEGAIYVENTGTPMDIALSADGQNLAVSVIDVSGGSAGTIINFYNFGTTGQNQVDNLVGTFRYANTIVPEITYADDSTMLAFADSGVIVFDGGDSPGETGRVAAEDEIQSVFYDDSYFGLVYSDASQDAGRLIRVYDTDCRERATIETDFLYDSVGFLDNHEICLYSPDRCEIYSLSGMQKFSHDFDEDVRAVFHRIGYRGYILIKENSTEQIRLKLFGDIFDGRRYGTEEN